MEKYILISRPDFWFPPGDYISTDRRRSWPGALGDGINLVGGKRGKRSSTKCSSEKDDEWGRQWLAGSLGGKGWEAQEKYRRELD